MRRDGFVSRDAGAAGGTLTTRLLQPGGSRLEVNATVAAGGALAVAVQDEHGQDLPGFAAADCTPVTGDSLRHAVRWGDRRGDDRWRARPVCLRFHLRDASLYAFRGTDAVYGAKMRDGRSWPHPPAPSPLGGEGVWIPLENGRMAAVIAADAAIQWLGLAPLWPPRYAGGRAQRAAPRRLGAYLPLSGVALRKGSDLETDYDCA